MSTKTNQDKLAQARRDEAASRRGYGQTIGKARRDSAKAAARLRPTVDEMFDDVQALLRRKPKG